MKQLFCILTLSLSFSTSQGQILNASFENGSNPDLSNWKWTCSAISFNNAPAGGGNWCIKVYGGNTQGCFPGYAYQKIPSITNGQTFILSGWAFAQTAPPIGLYFGKINNGVVTLQSGDTTSSTSWAHLSIQTSYTLSAGDTALVVLDGGLAGGPVQGYGYFDLINLQQVTGTNSPEQKQSFKISPNPFNYQTTLQTDNLLINATLLVVNGFGQTVKQIENISGQTVTFFRDNLASGLYFVRLTEKNKFIAEDKLVIID
ncbi:MAG: T9SS type A sorting domain-containing protein [Saprospiraceae bacterium]|nr:T9SS type A sorting domain-containing protein [Saprospiraceae bacterium]